MHQHLCQNFWPRHVDSVKKFMSSSLIYIYMQNFIAVCVIAGICRRSKNFGRLDFVLQIGEPDPRNTYLRACYHAKYGGCKSKAMGISWWFQGRQSQGGVGTCPAKCGVEGTLIWMSPRSLFLLCTFVHMMLWYML